MSTKEMEAMDNEVMGVVNNHATPESVANADEIAEREAVRQMCADEPQGSVPPERESAPRMGKPDAAPEKVRPDEFICRFKKKDFDEVCEKAEAAKRRKTRTTVILCVLLAAALLAVLAMPKLLTWLVNLGVGTCAVVAGIALDRRWRR